MPHYVSPHLETEPPKGFFPPEVEQWLFDNFFKLRRAVFVVGIINEELIVTNTAVETQIYELEIPANELHIGESFLIILSSVYSNDSAADDFTVRVYMNSTLIHSISRLGGNETNAGADIQYTFTTLTEGVVGSFIDSAIMIDASKSYAKGEEFPHVLDTTIDNVLSVTLQWDNAKVGNIFDLNQGRTLTYNPVPEP